MEFLENVSSAPFNVIVTIIIVVSLLINNYLSRSQWKVRKATAWDRQAQETRRSKRKRNMEKRGAQFLFLFLVRARSLARSFVRSLSLDVDDKKMERFFSSIPSNNIKLEEDRDDQNYCRWIIERERRQSRSSARFVKCVIVVFFLDDRSAPNTRNSGTTPSKHTWMLMNSLLAFEHVISFLLRSV